MYFCCCHFECIWYVSNSNQIFTCNDWCAPTCVHMNVLHIHLLQFDNFGPLQRQIFAFFEHIIRVVNVIIKMQINTLYRNKRAFFCLFLIYMSLCNHNSSFFSFYSTKLQDYLILIIFICAFYFQVCVRCYQLYQFIYGME